MTGPLIGYARCSTDSQDLTAQPNALTDLGVAPTRIYADHGLTGTNRDRPGPREAMAACREGDTPVVTKLDRLARSLSGANSILEELTTRRVRLSLAGALHDPTDPVGRLLFNVLAMVAEFEADLISSATPRSPTSVVIRGSAWLCSTVVGRWSRKGLLRCVVGALPPLSPAPSRASTEGGTSPTRPQTARGSSSASPSTAG